MKVKQLSFYFIFHPSSFRFTTHALPHGRATAWKRIDNSAVFINPQSEIRIPQSI
jgi:hypothetical protein